MGGIGGMLIGAFVIQRYGVIRLIQGCLLLLNLLEGILAFATVYWTQNTFLIVFIGVFCVFLTLVNIGVLALSMQLCWRRISAIQFIFCMTIFNTEMSVGAALFGYLRSYFDWQVFLLVFTFLIFVSMNFFNLIKTQKHVEQVDHLESKLSGKFLMKNPLCSLNRKWDKLKLCSKI